MSDLIQITDKNYEKEINEILRNKHKEQGFGFDEPINLKKLTGNEIAYLYRLLKFNLK